MLTHDAQTHDDRWPKMIRVGVAVKKWSIYKLKYKKMKYCDWLWINWVS